MEKTPYVDALMGHSEALLSPDDFMSPQSPNDEFMDTQPLSPSCTEEEHMHNVEIKELERRFEKDKDALKAASASTLQKLADRLSIKDGELKRKDDEIARLKIALAKTERGGASSSVQSELSEVLTGALDAKDRKLQTLQKELEQQQSVLQGYIDREHEYVSEIQRLEALCGEMGRDFAPPTPLPAPQPLMTMSALSSTPASPSADATNEALRVALEGEKQALRREAHVRQQMTAWEESQRARHAEHLKSLCQLEEQLQDDRTRPGSAPQEEDAGPAVTLTAAQHRAMQHEIEAQRKELLRLYEWMAQRRPLGESSSS